MQELATSLLPALKQMGQEDQKFKDNLGREWDPASKKERWEKMARWLIKSTGCSSREYGFNSQQRYGG